MFGSVSGVLPGLRGIHGPPPPADQTGTDCPDYAGKEDKMYEGLYNIFERIATALEHKADSLASIDYTIGEATEANDGE